eukprot:8564256-Pyramimonas_sp.AAC.1
MNLRSDPPICCSLLVFFCGFAPAPVMAPLAVSRISRYVRSFFRAGGVGSKGGRPAIPVFPDAKVASFHAVRLHHFTHDIL